MKVKNAYSDFATVYDLMGADRHSVQMVAYTMDIIRRFRIHVTSALDLCCGTGTALELFFNHGLQMSGLDGSAAMLAIAARKLRGKKITLYHKQLPKFKLLLTGNSRKSRQFDLITCFYDSLNYMKSPRELGTAFQSVQQHLHPGGWFIFDMNTPTALKTIWGNQVYAEAHENVAWIWKNKYSNKNKSATLQVTFFRRAGKTWSRFDELHVEYGYSNSQIRTLLNKAGFTVKGFYRCFTFQNADRHTNRICVIAQKRK